MWSIHSFILDYIHVWAIVIWQIYSLFLFHMFVNACNKNKKKKKVRTHHKVMTFRQKRWCRTKCSLGVWRKHVMGSHRKDTSHGLCGNASDAVVKHRHSINPQCRISCKNIQCMGSPRIHVPPQGDINKERDMLWIYVYHERILNLKKLIKLMLTNNKRKWRNSKMS